jgi:methyltransferase
MRVTGSVRLYLVFLALLYAERLVELVVSRRHERRLLAEGGREFGRRHFGVMAAFHVVFPAVAALEVWLTPRAFPGAIGIAALALALAAQGLRWWSVVSLQGAWTVKIVVSPRRAPVTRGPYRWLRHPNYVAVALEVLAVPLIHGAWVTAVVATAINAALLRVRIRREEEALGPSYADAFAAKPRWIPRMNRDSS